MTTPRDLSTEQALTAAVLAAPDDDLPRLVFADYLEERGEAGSAARAEFIRLQCALNHVGQLEPAHVANLRIREKVLLSSHGISWLAPLKKRGEPLFTPRSHGQFRRGFIEVVWMPAGWFLSKATKLFLRCPVRELRITLAMPAEFRALTLSPELRHLRVLDISDRRVGSLGVEWLALSPHVQALKTLRIRGCDVDDDALDALCSAHREHRWTLQELDIGHNAFSDSALSQLSACYGSALKVS